jgi:hypothetical protein
MYLGSVENALPSRQIFLHNELKIQRYTRRLFDRPPRAFNPYNDIDEVYQLQINRRVW